VAESVALLGGCLCGGVRFELTAELVDAGYCHCTRCQKRTGTGAGVSVAVNASDFRITEGEELVRGWSPPGGGNDKFFCSRCGAGVFARNPADHSRMGIRMAALDEPPGLPLSYHQYVSYAAAWEPIPDDGIPRYPESRFTSSPLG
jgi:hypothetical protein